MALINSIINEVLDLVFGKVYIATAAGVNIFVFMYDLIILACYIFMFKHFCSYLINMLTSLLSFDGGSFVNSTAGGAGSNGGFFGNQNIAKSLGITSQNWEKFTGVLAKTSGFRKVGKFAQRFNPFDKQGNLSVFAALRSIPKLKSEEFYKKREQFIKNRENEYQKQKNIKKSKSKYIENSFNNKKVTDDIYTYEMVKKSAESSVEKEYLKRRNNALIDQGLKNNINRLSKIKNANNKEIEELKNSLNLALNRGLIDQQQYNNILNGEVSNLDINTELTQIDKLQRTELHIKKDKIREENLKQIVKLAKLAQQGFIDPRLITDGGYREIDKIAKGKITIAEYERIIKYIKSQGFSTNYNVLGTGTIEMINDKLFENYDYLIKNSDNLSFEELNILDQIYRRDKIIDDMIKDELDRQNNEDQLEIDKLQKEIDATINGMEENPGTKSEELTVDEADISAGESSGFEKSPGTSGNNIAAGIGGGDSDDENQLTQDDENNLKRDETILKINDLKLKIAQFEVDKAKREIEKVKLNAKAGMDGNKLKKEQKEAEEAKQLAEKEVDKLKKDKKKIEKRIKKIKDKEEDDD